MVLSMKAQFGGWRDVYNVAQYAKLPITQAQAKAMWAGDFSGMPIEAVEAFWLVLGYELVPKKIRPTS